MLGKFKYYFLSLILIGSVLSAYSQSHSMPEPGEFMATSTPPPPPGLPLPIDDYLPLLLLAGMVYGAIKILGLKKS